MQIETSRAKTIILGCDYQTFYSYKRVFSKRPDLDIIGFVYPFGAEPPISSWEEFESNPLTIYPLIELESTIIKNKITKCLFSVNGIPMRKAQTLINRVTSTGICEIEFIAPEQMKLTVNKPVISFSSLAPEVGKTIIARYFCDILFKERKKVGVIIPINNIDPVKGDKSFVIGDGYHYQFGTKDKVPQGIFSTDVNNLITQYQKSGAYTIFLTTNVNRAIISCEQLTDIIIFDSDRCLVPQLSNEFKFCIVNRESITSPMNTSEWPGIVNAFDSTNIITMASADNKTTKEEMINIANQLKYISTTKSFFYVESRIHTDDSIDYENMKVLYFDRPNSSYVAPRPKELQEPNKFSSPLKPKPPSVCSQNECKKDVSVFVSEGIEDSPLKPPRRICNVPRSSSRDTMPPRSLSPMTLEVKKETEMMHQQFVNEVNNTDADIIVINFPFETKGIDPSKHLICTMKEIVDIDHKMFNWIKNNFLSNRKPPLQKHFESQVDVLLTMVNASTSELIVTNNESANREAFARLFLQSHIPPGYRVTSGEIFDCSSNNTGKLDCVIANDECPTMTLDASGSVIAPILADSVLCVVEVKTVLTVESLKKSLSQLRPVKALMPSHETIETIDGQIIADPLGGKIITGVFAYKVSGDVETKFGEIVNLYPHVADFIVLPDSFAFFSVEILTVCGISIGDKEIINGYVKYTPKGLGLALIFGVLNSLAAIRQFSASNYIRYLGGSWGGTQEAIERETQDAQSSLMKAHQMAIREADEEGKENFIKSEFALLNIIGSVFSSKSENENDDNESDDEY